MNFCMFSYMRWKVSSYENLQKRKHKIETSTVDVPVWHIYKAQEK